MQRNWIWNGLAALVVVVCSGTYLAAMVPAGPTSQIKVEVVSRASKSGPTGTSGVLICSLENGRKVAVSVPQVAKVRTGDTVFLNTHERYLFGPKFSFAGKLKP